MHKVAFDLVCVISVRWSNETLSCCTAYIADVLNRFRNNAKEFTSSSHSVLESTLRILMYIFPRQFHLHNVFTEKVDSRETVQPFKDYTLREDEINSKFPTLSSAKIPKRLRGNAAGLVRKLQALHGRCSYKELLEYYCPVSPNHFILSSH